MADVEGVFRPQTSYPPCLLHSRPSTPSPFGSPNDIVARGALAEILPFEEKFSDPNWLVAQARHNLVKSKAKALTSDVHRKYAIMEPAVLAACSFRLFFLTVPVG
jgi:hypothetical protein